MNRSMSNISPGLLLLSGLSLFLFFEAAIADDKAEAEVVQQKESFREFLLARASAEVCYGRVLNDQENGRFFKSLSYRDAESRSVSVLSEEAQGNLAAARNLVKESGCDSEKVEGALLDWRLRVTTFSQIEANDPL